MVNVLLFGMRNAPFVERDRLEVQFLDGEIIAVGNGDDRYFGDAVLFEEGKLVLRLDPESLFTLKRGGNDQFMCVGDVAVYAQGFKSDTVLDERQGDHSVELGAERLMGSEVFDKGKIIQEHLFAAAADGIVDKVEQPFLYKPFDGTIDKIFGDTEVFFGKHVDLMCRHGLCIVACKNKDQRLFVG